jgi:hypothetical protein
VADEDTSEIPIFRAVSSRWFAASAEAEQWQATVADDGWRAAAAEARPPTAGSTRSGMPRRIPGAQLVPGAAQPTAGQQVRPHRDPRRTAAGMAAFVRGRGGTAGLAAQPTRPYPAVSRESR